MNLTSPKFKMSALDNIVMKMKRQATDYEKIISKMHISQKTSNQINKQHSKLKNKKRDNPIKL